MATKTEQITIQLTAGEIQDLARLAKRMGQGRDELFQEIILRALETLRFMEDEGL